jgi:hypothetical protein
MEYKCIVEITVFWDMKLDSLVNVYLLHDLTSQKTVLIITCVRKSHLTNI